MRIELRVMSNAFGKHCGGCGKGNQSCAIARCSLEHAGVEYCYLCDDYPCKKYKSIDDLDSFITHRRQLRDLEKAKRMGIAEYNLEQEEKVRILDYLLSNYNDGRRKTFFCVTVNLLELSELQEAIDQIGSNAELFALPSKEKSSYVARVFQSTADRRGVKLKLNKKN